VRVAGAKPKTTLRTQPRIIMNSPTWLFSHEKETPRRSVDVVTTYAERVAIEALERAERRRIDRAEQASMHNAPDVRIRAWEKLHGLRLPLAVDHPVLDQVAAATGLTLAQVQEEQAARLARRQSRA
jgi:hypothetical protein